MDAGAVDAQENPVGDAGPAWILGAAVEARLKRRQRNGQTKAAPPAALSLLYPLPQPSDLIPRGLTALPRPQEPPTRPPRRCSATRTPVGPGPSPGCRAAAHLRIAADCLAPPCYLVRRCCAEPLEESMDLRLGRLRRHDLSFPDTTAVMAEPEQRRGRAEVRVPLEPTLGRKRVPAGVSSYLLPHQDSGGVGPVRYQPRQPPHPVRLLVGRGVGGPYFNRAQRRSRDPGWALRVRDPPRPPSSTTTPAYRPHCLSGIRASSAANGFLSLNGNVPASETPVSSDCSWSSLRPFTRQVCSRRQWRSQGVLLPEPFFGGTLRAWAETDFVE